MKPPATHVPPPDGPARCTPATLDGVARALIGPLALTPVDVARASGVDLKIARRFWRALGFPPVPDDQPFFAGADVAMLRAAAELAAQADGDLEVVLQMTRVLGQSLARIAEAHLSAVGARRRGDGGGVRTEIWDALADDLEPVVRSVEPFLGYVWRRHLLAALARLAADPTPGSPEGRELAVGFADMVGFSALSQQLEDRELAALVARFEAVASDVVAQGGGRVVKMIGDEVMFTADQPADAARIALDLVEAHGRDPRLPDLRVGLAFGPTVTWEGDLFGQTVNLASRLVNLARPATVLVDPGAARQLAAAPGFRLRPRRRIHMKGIGRVRVTVLQRAGGGTARGADPAPADPDAAARGTRE